LLGDLVMGIIVSFQIGFFIGSIVRFRVGSYREE